ncbi:MAG: FkbM family methyltransferase [Rhodospirillaceae bacterium]|nr:FkbM family methyltransferase [Rhodospirillaceae bacterium]
MVKQTQYDALMRELSDQLRGLVPAPDLRHTDNRFIRADVLQSFAVRLHAAMRLFDYPYEIVVRPEGIFVAISGVLLDVSSSGLYLKASGAPVGLQAEVFAQTLRRRNIDVATFVDVGANFGEVSLSMAREYPAARIVAIEPSADNLAVFERNKQVQRFPTGNIEVVKLGIADKAGPAAISRGANPMSRVTPAGGADTEAIMCERLDTLFDQRGIREADFVKIDIEGGEPKLKDALIALGRRVKAYCIEFSQFAPFDDYMTLTAALRAQQFECYDESAAVRLTSGEEIARHLRAAFAPGKIAVTNLWFFAAARLTV